MNGGHALTQCAKCWTDATVIAERTGRSPGQTYWGLYLERRYSPCTYEEQTGVPEVVPKPAPISTEMDDMELAAIHIEEQCGHRPGDRMNAVQIILGMTPTQYAMLLHKLLTKKAEVALAASPVVVNRLLGQQRRSRNWRLT